MRSFILALALVVGASQATAQSGQIKVEPCIKSNIVDWGAGRAEITVRALKAGLTRLDVETDGLMEHFTYSSGESSNDAYLFSTVRDHLVSYTYVWQFATVQAASRIASAHLLYYIEQASKIVDESTVLIECNGHEYKASVHKDDKVVRVQVMDLTIMREVATNR